MALSPAGARRRFASSVLVEAMRGRHAVGTWGPGNPRGPGCHRLVVMSTGSAATAGPSSHVLAVISIPMSQRSARFDMSRLYQSSKADGR